MNTEEYRDLWQGMIRMCEMESNENFASLFIKHYCYSQGQSTFDSMSNEELLLTFVKLVVYEQKFHVKLGSTTPTTFCYRELLARAEDKRMDKEFVYDVGDWAADYSDNSYVPMDGGGGPRQHFAFWKDYELRVAAEQQAKEERLEKKRAEGWAKVEAAKLKQQERLETIQQLRGMSVDESISYIEKSGKPVFYFIEYIEELFKNNSLNEDQKEKLLSMFPNQSTRHNINQKKFLDTIYHN